MGTPPFNVVLPRVHYGLLLVFACTLPLLAERDRKSRTVSPDNFARSRGIRVTENESSQEQHFYQKFVEAMKSAPAGAVLSYTVPKP